MAGEGFPLPCGKRPGKGGPREAGERGDDELMADAVLVVLLLVFIWAAVLVPPAAGARASREAEFLGSLRGDDTDPLDGPRFHPALTANARRRQVLGGLVVALGTTLALGLLPTFRLLLVVHLLLLNSFLAYVALLVKVRDERMARAGTPTARSRWQESEVAEVEALAALAEEPAYALAGGRRYSAVDESSSWEEYDGGASSYDGYDEYDEYGDAGDAGGYDDELGLDDEAEAAYIDEELGLARPA